MTEEIHAQKQAEADEQLQNDGLEARAELEEGGDEVGPLKEDGKEALLSEG